MCVCVLGGGGHGRCVDKKNNFVGEKSAERLLGERERGGEEREREKR